jgi:hypothetical protein
MRKPAVWSTAKNDQLRSLCLTDLSNSEIAAVLVTSTDAVKRQKRRLGIPVKPARTQAEKLVASHRRKVITVDEALRLAAKLWIERRRLGVGGEGHH